VRGAAIAAEVALTALIEGRDPHEALLARARSVWAPRRRLRRGVRRLREGPA
jgi:hypothetical protein